MVGDNNMNLTRNLLKHKNNSNELLVNEMIEFIESENIINEEDLKRVEDKYFTIDGKILNNKKRVEYYYKNLEKCYFDYDNLSKEDSIIYKNLKNSLSSDISINAKILNIIKINVLTNREIMFYKEAYDYIIHDLT